MATTKYQISMYADKLGRRFLGRRPTPYAVVTLNGKDIGRTEIRESTTNPDWCFPLKLEFSLEQSVKVPFKVSIYDWRGVRSDKLLAKADFEALEVFRSPGHMQMKEDANGAQIFVDIHESIQGPYRGSIQLRLRGLDMKNVEPGLLGLGRSDPFFEISKKNSDHAAGIVRWNSVYRSEHINDHLNPYWEPFTIGLEELCYCDLDWPLKIAVYDWEESGRHRQIGEFEVTTRKLIERVAVKGNADREQAFDLILDELTKLKGLVCVLKAELSLEQGVPLTADQGGGVFSTAVYQSDAQQTVEIPEEGRPVVAGV